MKSELKKYPSKARTTTNKEVDEKLQAYEDIHNLHTQMESIKHKAFWKTNKELRKMFEQAQQIVSNIYLEVVNKL